MSSSMHGTYVGSDHIALSRELWVLVIRGLDGDPVAREEGRDRLLGEAPPQWDADLDDDAGSGWQPARPEVAPSTRERPEGTER